MINKFIAAITIYLTTQSLALADSPLKVAFFDSYAPLSWSDKGDMKGILIDILNATLKDQLNLNVQYRGYPWKRAQALVKSGDADAFVTVPTKTRLNYTHCSATPAITVNAGVYTYANNPKINQLMKIKTLEDLKGFLIVDYIGNGWAKTKFKNLEVKWTPTLDQSFKILAAKRADVLVRNNFNFDYFSKNLGLKNKIIKLPAILNSVNFHLCINKNSPYAALLNDFDQSMVQFNKDGKLDSIANKYKN